MSEKENTNKTSNQDLIDSAIGKNAETKKEKKGIDIKSNTNEKDEINFDDDKSDKSLPQDNEKDIDSDIQSENYTKTNQKPNEDELNDKIVFINRCAKVVKGGRRFSFSALIVAGNNDGWVGYGFGKANEATEAIMKATKHAKRSIQYVKRKGTTIPHEINGKFSGGKVLLKPACEGTGVIAGGAMRAVLEMAGIKDVLAKSLGSNNHANVVKATLSALLKLRTKQEIMAIRA